MAQKYLAAIACALWFTGYVAAPAVLSGLVAALLVRSMRFGGAVALFLLAVAVGYSDAINERKD